MSGCLLLGPFFFNSMANKKKSILDFRFKAFEEYENLLTLGWRSLCMSTRSSIFMVIKIQFLKFVGFHANPPFLSFFVKVQFQSPPIINLVSSD